MKVGFIGLGIMGASMASNLQKAGHELAVHDIRKDAAAPHLAAGATWKDSPKQVAESAGAYEGFRRMNRETREMPEDVAKRTADAKATYLDAIRDWVRRGPESAHVFAQDAARAHVAAPGEDVAQAHAAFRLGQLLIRRGQEEEGRRWLAEASRLHPESWCIWRQQAGVNDAGLAALPDFWQRVDALGDRRYYAKVDMPGMP